MDMKTRAIDTQQPEHDSLTSRKRELDGDDDAEEKQELDKDSKENKSKDQVKDSELNEINNESKPAANKSSDEKAILQDVNNNDESESIGQLKNDENNNTLNDNKGMDVAGVEPTKPLHGILSTSKNRLGNGRMESPEKDLQVPAATTDEEPGKASFMQRQQRPDFR